MVHGQKGEKSKQWQVKTATEMASENGNKPKQHLQF